MDERSDLRTGRNIMLAVVAMYLLFGVVRSALGGLVGVYAIAVIALAVWGAIKVCNGLDYSGTRKTLAIVCAFLPFLNFITAVSLVIRAHRGLSAA